MSSSRKPLLFNTLSYGYLAEKMLRHAPRSFERGVLVRNTTREGNPEDDRPFNDGERYLQVGSDVDDRECVVVGGTISDTETLDLFDIGNVLFDAGALRIKFVVPFYGYSTMERAVKPREAVKAKYRARLLSAIPQVPMGNRFYFVDLHAGGLEHYMENRQVRHVYAKPIVLEAAREMADGFVLASSVLDVTESGSEPGVAVQIAGKNYVLGSTDAGRMKWIESLAKDMGVFPAFAYKHREGNATETLGISGPVKGRWVIIYDDMIRTGGSLIGAAQAYMDAGALGIYVICTHGILPGDAMGKLQRSGLFQRVVTSDSLPRPEQLLDTYGELLRVKSLAPLLVSNVRGTTGRR